MIERDRHIRRSGADYAEAFAALLPTGAAWPRDPNSVLMRYVRGQAEIWGFVDSRAADLLEMESDPRATLELLPDWERAFGLPDPCVTEPQTIEERRRVLVQRITALGGQSRAFFYSVAQGLGYQIYIREYAPFMAGISRAGDTRKPGADAEDYRWRVGSQEMRFYWTVKVLNRRLSWFRAASGQAGIDPHVRISRAKDLECVFQRWKPAHTQIVFDYSEASIS